MFIHPWAMARGGGGGVACYRRKQKIEERGRREKGSSRVEIDGHIVDGESYASINQDQNQSRITLLLLSLVPA